MKKLIFLIILKSLFIDILHSQTKSNFEEMIFYKQGIGVNVSMQLTLSKDMTFVEYTKALSCVDRSMSTNTISGVFKVDKNKIILTPLKQIFYDYQGNCTKYEGTETILKSNIFFSEYKIVKHKDLILLLYDSTTSPRYTNDFINIANAINQKDGETEIRYIWKNKDNGMVTLGKDIVNSFPLPWNEYVLSKPLCGKVIKTQPISKTDKFQYKYLGDGSKYLYTIDIGEEAGIRNGMLLYAQGKNDCLCELIILEVENKQCIGYVLQYQEENCKKILEYSTKE